MPDEAILDAGRAYFEAAGHEGALPELPDDPVDAFIEIVDAISGLDQTFELLDAEPDPYPGLSVEGPNGEWAFHWALSLSGLEPFFTDALPDSVFYLDIVADPSGAHRVYVQTEGEADDLAFASIPAALRYMAARVAHDRGTLDEAALRAAEAEHGATLDDKWEDGPTSGRYAFERLLEIPLGDAWDAYSRGEWVLYDRDAMGIRVKAGQPGDQRAFAIWTTEKFLARRKAMVAPGMDEEALESGPRALLANLRDLEASMESGELPEAVKAAQKDEALSELANAWAERHEAFRAAIDDEDEDAAEAAPAPEPEPEPEPAAPRRRRMVSGGDAPAGSDAPKKKAAKKTTKKKAAASEDDGLSDEGIKRLLSAVMGGGGGGGGGDLLAALGGGGEDEEDLEPPPETPFMKKLRIGLSEALDAMLDKELIELESDHRPALLEELVVAGAEARGPQHLLSLVTKRLVHSDHVEEIYATDGEIRGFLETLVK